MNKELLLKIIMELESFDQRKAHKLGALLDEYEQVPQNIKADQRKKIQNYVYNLFTSLLSRKTRNELFNVCTDITEDCYHIEQASNDGWFIDNGGAGRYVVENGKWVTKAFIPRIYKNGFEIDEAEEVPFEERKKEVELLDKYSVYFDSLARRMDRKQEIITCDYETRSRKVPHELMELLITYLGFMRLTEEQVKSYKAESIQKRHTS